MSKARAIAVLEAELANDPALVMRILRELPSAAPEPEWAVIRTDAASVDMAIARALALAVVSLVARIELTKR